VTNVVFQKKQPLFFGNSKYRPPVATCATGQVFCRVINHNICHIKWNNLCDLEPYKCATGQVFGKGKNDHQLAALGRKSARSYDMVIKGMEDLYTTTRDALTKKPLTVGRPNVGLVDGTQAGPSNPRKTTAKGRKEYKRKKSATEK
jgi:hypothetical protein